jgi:hypothetical protein
VTAFFWVVRVGDVPGNPVGHFFLGGAGVFAQGWMVFWDPRG